MLKNNKGITLVALVVTIIVLLILAGVSITMVSGDNGIATKAQTAKKQTEEEKLIEALELKFANLEIESFTGDSTAVLSEIMGEMLKGAYRYEEGTNIVKIHGILENDEKFFEVNLILSKEEVDLPATIKLEDVKVVEKVDELAEPLLHYIHGNTGAFSSIVNNGNYITVTYNETDYNIYMELGTETNIAYTEKASTNV